MWHCNNKPKKELIDEGYTLPIPWSVVFFFLLLVLGPIIVNAIGQLTATR